MKIFAGISALILTASLAWGQINKKLTIDHITGDNLLQQKTVEGIAWMPASPAFLMLEFDTLRRVNHVLLHDYSKKSAIDTLVNGERWRHQFSIDDFSLNPSGTKILIASNRQSIYRHSTVADYYLLDLAGDEVLKISSEHRVSNPSFSPDGTKIAYVKNNDLYFTDIETGLETQITNDGEYNFVINGQTDWVYEEEFGFTKAYCWSPDSRHIAFLKFDESRVSLYPMQFWARDYARPLIYTYKYPLAGEENARVTVNIYDMLEQSIRQVDIGTEEDVYLPAIQWIPGTSKLSVSKLNRLQNQMDILHVDAIDLTHSTVYRENSDTYVDFEFTGRLIYTQDGKSFLKTSERDGYNHIYHFTRTGSLIGKITDGNWEVDEILGLDENQGLVYYTSTEQSPLERHIYVASLDGTSKKQITKKRGFHRFVFNDTFTHYLHYHNSANQPMTVKLKTVNGRELQIIENNDPLRSGAKVFGFTEKEFFDFTTSDGTTLFGYMIKPPEFDPHKKYPLLVYVYGGPGSQKVTREWDSWHWHRLMAQEGYIIACIDNRGTRGRGKAFRDAVYKQLGKYELADQIEGVQFLSRCSFVDPNRIGIWGWSYGGYLSSMALCTGSNDFEMAISVAPVTDWRLYDTIYTERYMQRPGDNPEGYDSNNPLALADKMEGAFLLIHGMNDHNVHLHHSIALQKALIQSNKQFNVFYFPDGDHSLNQGQERVSLFTLITSFVRNNL